MGSGAAAEPGLILDQSGSLMVELTMLTMLTATGTRQAAVAGCAEWEFFTLEIRFRAIVRWVPAVEEEEEGRPAR